MSAERGTPEQCEPPAGESAEKAKEFHQLTAQEGVEAVERGDKPTVLLTANEKVLTSLPFFSDTYYSPLNEASQTTTVYHGAGEERRAERILELVRGMNTFCFPANRSYHTELGRLLGYKEQAISEYVAWTEAHPRFSEAQRQKCFT